MSLDSGLLAWDLYIEFTGPTFVTLLVRLIVFLRFGIVIEGRFTSRIEGLIMGQVER